MHPAVVEIRVFVQPYVQGKLLFLHHSDMHGSFHWNRVVVGVIGENIIPIREISRLMKQEVFAQLIPRGPQVIGPSPEKKVLVVLIVVVRGEVNRQSIQGVGDGQIVTHSQLASTSG